MAMELVVAIELSVKTKMHRLICMYIHYACCLLEVRGSFGTFRCCVVFWRTSSLQWNLCFSFTRDYKVRQFVGICKPSKKSFCFAHCCDGNYWLITGLKKWRRLSYLSNDLIFIQLSFISFLLEWYLKNYSLRADIFRVLESQSQNSTTTNTVLAGTRTTINDTCARTYNALLHLVYVQSNFTCSYSANMFNFLSHNSIGALRVTHRSVRNVISPCPTCLFPCWTRPLDPEALIFYCCWKETICKRSNFCANIWKLDVA